MDIHKLVSLAQSNDSSITIEATVVTGFEEVALDECREKFGSSIPICSSMGRIFFNINSSDINNVKTLKGVDNIIFIIDSVQNFGFSCHVEKDTLTNVEKDTLTNVPDDEVRKMKDLEILKQYVKKIKWKKYIELWRQMTKYQGVLYPTMEQFNTYNDVLREVKKKIKLEKSIIELKKNIETVTVDSKGKKCKKGYRKRKQGQADANENTISLVDTPSVENTSATDVAEPVKIIETPTENILKTDETKNICDKEEYQLPSEQLFKFRVTTNRVGIHLFTSMECDRAFGGELNDVFHWLVDLDNYDIDIHLQIRDNQGYVGLSFTEQSLHKRNIVEFNITTLKSTIGYNMVRLSEPKLGDVILDPMCGGGTIPVECSLAYPETFFLCSDLGEKLVNKTQSNVEFNRVKTDYSLLVAPFVCNVKHLCVRNQSVDAIISDLPFGKRVGSKSNNFILYRLFLIEIARVSRPSSGRAVLLTSDRKHLIQALHITNSLWNLRKVMRINMSGIKSFVFLLSRTPQLFDYAIHALQDKHRGTPRPRYENTKESKDN